MHDSGKVLMHIECLRGTGELTLAAMVAEALADKSADVTIVSGHTGSFIHEREGIRIRPLPRIRFDDGRAKSYLTEEGLPLSAEASKEWREKRAAELRRIADEVKPEALLICYWPFANGRHTKEEEAILDPELESLLRHTKTARPDTLVFGSIREVLHADSQPYGGKGIRAAKLLYTHYTKVFVHGDELTDETDYARLLRKKPDLFEFTGLICRPREGMPREDANMVILAAGGADYRPSSENLLKKEIAALDRIDADFLQAKSIRVLVGSRFPQDIAAEIHRQAMAADERLKARGVHADLQCIPTRPREEYRKLLEDCALYVGQGGIGSVLDAIEFGYRTVVVPVNERGPNGGYHFKEQLVRAERMQQKNILRYLTQHELDAPGGVERLAGCVNEIIRTPLSARAPIRCHGAENTADSMLREIARNRLLSRVRPQSNSVDSTSPSR